MDRLRFPFDRARTFQNSKKASHMPVAKGPSFDLRSAAIFGGVAVLAAVIIGLIALELGTRSNTLVLGSIDFGDVNVTRLAESIEERGPLLFPDIASGSRDIWVSHIGESPGEGWFAFEARLPGESRDCSVEWVATDRNFVNGCSGDVFPVTGDGLPQIPVFIDGTDLIIDLNGIHSESDFQGFVPPE